MTTLTKNKKGNRRRTESHRKDGGRRRRGQEAEEKGSLREWFDSIIVVLVVMIIVRTLFLDMFRIPTPSMEEGLLVGDYIFVSKMHYGTRTPMTIGVPLTSWRIRGLELPWTRLPGFDDVNRYDAMVFNDPADSGNEIISRKEHLIKRVIGLPGDTVSVRDKIAYVNGARLPMLPGMQFRWDVYKEDPRMRLPLRQMDAMSVDSVWSTTNPNVVLMNATKLQAERLEALPAVERVEPHVVPSNWGYQLFPAGRDYTRDNYGPVHIPAQGQTVTLTDENWTMYGPLIARYEGHEAARVGENQFLIDGQRTNTYTFEQDYFFVMGDNRDNSDDSRFWGYVPMSHVVGKAVMVYFSWDAEEMMPRFGRIFHLL